MVSYILASSAEFLESYASTEVWAGIQRYWYVRMGFMAEFAKLVTLKRQSQRPEHLQAQNSVAACGSKEVVVGQQKRWAR